MDISIQNRINGELSRVCKELTGRGPKHIKTAIANNLVVVEIQLYETPILLCLKKSEKGMYILGEMSEEVFKQSKDRIQEVVMDVLKCDITEIYFDYDVKQNKKIIVCILKNVNKIS